MEDGATGRSPWKSRDIVLAACGGALAVAMFVGSHDYPDLPWSVGGSPKFFPQALSVVLAVLSVGVVIEAWLRGARLGRPPADTVGRALAALAVFAVTPWLLEALGFRVAAIVVGLAVMVLMTERRNLTRRGFAIMIAVAVGASLILHFAFEDLAGRRLPAGLLFG